MARRNHNALRSGKQSVCSFCFKTKKKLLFGLDTHLFQCGVCGATVCSNCVGNVKQILFLGLEAPISKRPCCSNCIQDARVTCGVRPGEPEFEVIADYYVKLRSRAALSSSSPVGNTSRSPLPQYFPLDTMTRNRGSGRRQSILKITGSSGMPTNSTADDSLDNDPFLRELDEADFCFSDEESNSSVVVQPDPSPNMSDDSDKSTLTVWRTRQYLHDDDFVPATPSETNVLYRSDLEMLHQTLFQLNVTAENTLARTQATARMLHNGELN